MLPEMRIRTWVYKFSARFQLQIGLVLLKGEALCISLQNQREWARLYPSKGVGKMKLWFCIIILAFLG